MQVYFTLKFSLCLWDNDYKTLNWVMTLLLMQGGHALHADMVRQLSNNQEKIWKNNIDIITTQMTRILAYWGQMLETYMSFDV